MIGDRTTRSMSFAPLIPGLRAYVLHRVSPVQFRLLELLTDDYRTEEIQQRLLAEFSHLPPGAVSSMLNQLDRVGLLEEADVHPPADWTPAYLERYSRHLAAFAMQSRGSKRNICQGPRRPAGTRPFVAGRQFQRGIPFPGLHGPSKVSKHRHALPEVYLLQHTPRSGNLAGAGPWLL
jgi:hypothetical protein